MLFFLLLQTSCSSKGGSDGTSGGDITSTPTSTATPLAAPVVVRVTPAGNTVSIATSESTSVSFIFPPGAVSEPLDVTLTPHPATGSSWFAVSVEPAGKLLSAPVLIRADIPSYVSAAEIADLTLRFSGTSDSTLLTTTLNGSTLEASSMALGLPGFVGQPASATAAPKLASGKVQRVPSLPSPADILNVLPVSFATKLALADNLFTVLRATNRYRDALELASLISSILQGLGNPALEGQVRTWVARVWPTACAGFTDARTNMASNLTGGHPFCLAEAKHFERPLLFWMKVLMILQQDAASGMTCAGFTDDAWRGDVAHYVQNVVESQKADITRMWRCDCEQTPEDERTLWLWSRCHTLGVAGYETLPAHASMMKSADPLLPTTEEEWDHLADTVSRAYLTLDQLTYIGIDASDTRTELVEPHFAFARDMAWKGCQRDGKTLPVGKLLAVLPDLASLQEDGQYCGTTLSVQAKDSSGNITDQLAQPLGGVSTGVTNTIGSMNANKQDTLTLSGPIGALYCPADHTGGSETLELRLDGTLIQTLDAAPYLSNPLDIDMATALGSAHPGAVDTLDHATMTVERTGTPCDGIWGDNPSPLLTLNLTFNPLMKASVGKASRIVGSMTDDTPVNSDLPVTLSFQPSNAYFGTCAITGSVQTMVSQISVNTIVVDFASSLTDPSNCRPYNETDYNLDVTFSKAGTLTTDISPATECGWTKNYLIDGDIWTGTTLYFRSYHYADGYREQGNPVVPISAPGIRHFSVRNHCAGSTGSQRVMTLTFTPQ